jgi:hypothetical protein
MVRFTLCSLRLESHIHFHVHVQIALEGPFQLQHLGEQFD